MAGDDAALLEQVPPFVPAGLRRFVKPVASLAVEHLRRKYRIGSDAQHEAKSRSALDALRSALSDGRRYLLGDAFSFADVTMAAALQFVLPVADRYISLGPATRHAWTHPELAREYHDLLRWRDTLYAERRPKDLLT